MASHFSATVGCSVMPPAAPSLRARNPGAQIPDGSIRLIQGVTPVIIEKRHLPSSLMNAGMSRGLVMSTFRHRAA